MKVYLVRHGVTNEAENNRRQFPYSSLSKEGAKQARAVALRLLTEDVDVILCSEWIRAKETANIIAAELNKPIEEFAGIHEKEHSAALHGTKIDSSIHQEHDEDLKNHWGDLDWKFRNEGESLREVTQRAALFRDHLLNSHQDQNVLVVSHSGFIRGFISSCILGDNYLDEVMLRLWLGIRVRNTGVSLLEHDNSNGIWSIEYLNDHFHLNPPG